jgi:hypothetical protein
MSLVFWRHLPRLLAVGALLLLSGCGGTAKVEGKILNNGAAVTIREGEFLNVSFHGTNAKGAPTVVPADVKPDGTFVADKVPPGKYKVVIAAGAATNDDAGLARTVELNKPFEAAKGKLECEITGGGTQRLTVDVGKGTVDKQ